jgi:ABC-type transport system involved in multi-copper enzyme maturation permease subunit
VRTNLGCLFRAEWQKITGNRMVALALVWIFPLAALAGATVIALLTLAVADVRAVFASNRVAELWNSLTPELWALSSSVPGRIILIGIATLVFAGEYQWYTWKNIVPRTRRSGLILGKYLTVGVLLLVSFASAIAILALGAVAATALAGGPLAQWSGDVLADFAVDFVFKAMLTFVSIVIFTGFAALACIYTRSILGGVLISLAAAIGEQFSLMVLGQVATWVQDYRVLELYRLTPSYNLANAASWVDSGYPDQLLSGLAFDSLTFSVGVLLAWALALVALSTILFQRQDIVS